MASTFPTNGQADIGAAWPVVHLGDERYNVVPQRIGRLKKRLGLELEGIQGIDLDSGIPAFVASSLDRAHAILKVFIPDLMPLWEFMGYRSEEAMKDDDIPLDGKDYGPDIPQIIDAFQVVMRVNRLDLFKHLGKVVDADLVKAYINRQMVDLMIPEKEEAKEISPTTS